MATSAHCIYCFESLAARLEKRPALTLQEVTTSWAEYTGDSEMEQLTNGDDEQASADSDEETPHPHNLRPRQISRLQGEASNSPNSHSSSSTPSNSSSQTLSNETSKTSSKSSLTSFLSPSAAASKEEEYPLFVTWNTLSSRGNRSLRGCIGCFDPLPLSTGLRDYALTAALDDHRFSPISKVELPSLQCELTLLLNFTPCNDPLDWEVGTHGIRIAFSYHGRRYGSTYLPQVMSEQGWSKEQAIVSLMRKAGWSGRSSEWRKVADFKCTRYEGKNTHVDYADYKAWRDWLVTQS